MLPFRNCFNFNLFKKGIVRALKEHQAKLQEHKVSIFVRRGGPNYQEGLRVMREVGELISDYQIL